MKKVLYADIPFTGINDGGANRSKFIWNSLVSQYEVDWLQLQRPGIPEGKGLPSGMNNHFILQTDVDRRATRPVIIYRFCKKSVKQLRIILEQGQYDLLFCRFLSPAALASVAKPHVKTIIFDVDMMLSRLTRLSWQQNPVFKNRYYLIESWKLEAFEKRFFRNQYLFLFTNLEERKMICNKVGGEDNGRFKVLPNVMEEQPVYKPENKKRVIFFGTLTSAANADALQYLSDDLYPHLAEELEKHDVYLDVIGRGWHENFKQYFRGKKRLRYVGEVDNIQQEISNSLFVFLPLRIASGTRTRILEAANQAVPVITTTIGAEGFDFDQDEIVIRDTPDSLIEEFCYMLKNESRRENMGKKLRLKSRALYLAKNVSEKLISMIEKEM